MMKLNQRVKIQATLLAVGLIVSSSACKKSGTSVVYPPNFPGESCFMFGSNITGQQARDCCEKNAGGVMVPKNTSAMASGACPSAPGIAAIQSSAISFTQAGIAGKSALAGARALEKQAQTHQNVAAATAEGMDVAGEGQGGVGKLSSLEELMKSKNSDGAGRKGGGGAASGGGGEAFGMGEVNTGAVAKLPTEPQMAAPGDGAGGIYAGGGGGGGAAAKGSAVDWDAMAGRGFGSGAAGSGVGTTDFGRGPASGDVMASADPEDYFSRLKSGDNIFKIVERRYNSKAQNWAVTDAKSAAAKK